MCACRDLGKPYKATRISIKLFIKFKDRYKKLMFKSSLSCYGKMYPDSRRGKIKV